MKYLLLFIVGVTSISLYSYFEFGFASTCFCLGLDLYFANNRYEREIDERASPDEAFNDGITRYLAGMAFFIIVLCVLNALIKAYG